MKFRNQLLASMTGLTLLVAGAQAGTLANIYQQAVNNDPQLKAAEATYRADAEALPQARAGLLPTLSLSANSDYRDSDSASLSDGNSNGYSLSLSQPVFRAQSWFTFKQGQVLSHQAETEFGKAQQDLITRTLEAYLDVLQAQTNLTTSQAEEKAIKRRLDQVQVQFEVGLIAITDVHEAQAAYDNARVNRIIAEGELDNSFEALERLTDQAYTQIDALAGNYPIEALNPDQRQPWLEKARADNLEFQITRLQTDAAKQATKASHADHYPTLDLTASYSDDDNSTFSGESNQIGLTLNLPLFSGGLTSSRHRESQQRWYAAREFQEDTLRKVQQDTRSLFRDLRTDRATVKARQQAIKSSETALEATAAGFEVGTRNVVDVLQAERQLFAAQRDYATARYEYVRDLFRFKQAVGTLNPEDIDQLDRWMTAETL
jgi:outer membrane protein